MLERLKLALDRIESYQWRIFEEFAAAFLSGEFPRLRTVANESGDDGVDALLLCDDAPYVLLQFSIRKGWQQKIVETAKRLATTNPQAQQLVYVTHLAIQHEVQSARERLRRDFRIGLDVRDRSWFLQNVDMSVQTAAAAERLAKAIVDPLLEDIRSARRAVGPQGLSTEETRAACIYLALQVEDDTREKGLTKLCFDGLVRAALRETSADRQLPRGDVQTRVRQVLSTHPPEVVDEYTNAALSRMAKRAIRYYPKEDSFCLSHDERERLGERLIALENQKQDLLGAIAPTVQVASEALDVQSQVDAELMAQRVLQVVEGVLLRKGQDFVGMVREGRPFTEPRRAVEDAVTAHLSEAPWKHSTVDPGTAVALLADAATRILTAPPAEVHGHLRALADAHVLMAFIRETTDVQGAVVKLFSSGELWLDTSILLPVFAEALLPNASHGQFTSLLRAAAEAGLSLRVTRGVVEEIERHMNRALILAEGSFTPPWRGRVPFLYAAFLDSGAYPGEFRQYLERFRGSTFPEQDLVEYLSDAVSLQVGSLEDELKRVKPEERHAVTEFWVKIQERRRDDADEPVDAMAIKRLADHDVENFLGVILRRKQEHSTALGYSTWWVTFDGAAFSAHRGLAAALGERALHSPVMTPDFLVNYLAIGPCRKALSQRSGAGLPLLLSDMAVLDLVPPELLDRAAAFRAELAGLPEAIVRRKVRDHLHAMRLRQGMLSRRGARGVEETVRERIRASAKKDGKAH